MTERKHFSKSYFRKKYRLVAEITDMKEKKRSRLEDVQSVVTPRKWRQEIALEFYP